MSQKLVVKDVATSALATDLTGIETAVLAVRTKGNQAKVEELLVHLQEAARLIHELHL